MANDACIYVYVYRYQRGKCRHERRCKWKHIEPRGRSPGSRRSSRRSSRSRSRGSRRRHRSRSRSRSRSHDHRRSRRSPSLSRSRKRSGSPRRADDKDEKKAAAAGDRVDESNDSDSKEQKKAPRCAYVCLVMKGDSYTAGALVAGHSLRQTGTVHAIICMVTDDVSEAARARLRLVFDRVVEVPYLRYECHPLRTAKQRDMYAPWVNDAFTKWNMVCPMVVHTGTSLLFYYAPTCYFLYLKKCCIVLYIQ
jgi:hypothetical protein